MCLLCHLEIQLKHGRSQYRLHKIEYKYRISSVIPSTHA